MYMIRAIGLGFATFVVAGCNVTSRMEIPTLARTDIVEFDRAKELQPIAFQGATAMLRRGTVIAHFPGISTGSSKLSGTSCNLNHKGTSTLQWSSGGRLLSGWGDELGQVFFDTMKSAGLNIVGDPRSLFDVKEERQGARYLVGAQIREIRGNICEEHDLWYGLPTGKYSAEFYQKVDWTLYAPATKERVAKFSTEGYGIHKQPAQEGIMTAFVESFAAAADGLIGDKRFYALISSDDIDVEEAKAEAQRGKENFDLLKVKKVKLSHDPISENVTRVVNGTVTVRVGGGHGSGFVISKDGYILTNNHVVGTAKKVIVIFSNGVEVMADVLRRDKIRDVALLKVSAKGLAVQPLDISGELKRLDSVFAAGTPTVEELKATITKGIVSAFRKYEREGQMIQADVDISAGNSGGPLFDEKGNVVGISVAGYSSGGFSAGLNLFIPIDRALEALHIKLM